MRSSVAVTGIEDGSEPLVEPEPVTAGLLDEPLPLPDPLDEHAARAIDAVIAKAPVTTLLEVAKRDFLGDNLVLLCAAKRLVIAPTA